MFDICVRCDHTDHTDQYSSPGHIQTSYVYPCQKVVENPTGEVGIPVLFSSSVFLCMGLQRHERRETRQGNNGKHSMGEGSGEHPIKNYDGEGGWVMRAGGKL